MKKLVLRVLLVGILLLPVVAFAADTGKSWVDENTINNQSVFKLEKARELIQAMKVKAEEIKVPMVMVVADATGEIVAMERMDGSALVSLKIAPNKARTAARMRMSTEELAKSVVPGQSLYGIDHDPDIIGFGGGIPLMHEGIVVGAIGVSSGSVEEDVSVAKAGLAAFEKK
jgi:uncharacterized protein GlcG (DUF336 family)